MEVRSNIFWNFVKIFWMHKIFIIISCAVVFVGTFIITTLMPKTYKANLTFVVLEEERGLNLSSIVGELPFKLGGLTTTDVDKFIAFLKSRRIRDVIIQKFDLWEEYKVDYIEQLYKSLDRDVEIVDNLDGTVTINCYFKRYPEKAVQMAQTFYDELYKVVLELNREKSTDFRLYMENSYNETQKKLAALEDSMRVFQLQNRVVEFETQTKSSFEAVAELEAEKQKYKVQMDYLSTVGTSSNEKLKELQLKYDIVDDNIQRLIKEGENYILALENLPNKGLTYYRLFRDIKIQQKIVEILLPLYQNAKMEEQKKTANLQLLDAPFIPQYKSKPKRLTYMIVITFILFALEILFFAVKETYRNSKTEIKAWLNQ